MKVILIDAVDTFAIDDGNGYHIFTDMQTLLDSFSNEKILLTSANDEQFLEWHLDQMPYEVFTLKHNPEKMDPAYYETMLRHFELDPKNVIYFEHNPKAVESAQAVGITTYKYDEKQADLIALKKFLEENLQK